MAYVQNEEEQKQGAAGGSVLAGSGGAASAGQQAVGTGFTNLQKYLSANKDQGQGIASDITSQGQKAVDTARTAADTQATGFVDYAAQQANSGADNVVGTIDTSIKQLETDRRDRQGALDAQKLTYGGPQGVQDVQGYNDLDKAYQNVKNTATNFANDRATQQAGLQQKYGYGGGFAALDTFLGRQDGKDQIQGWAAGVNPGSAQGAYDKANAAITGAKGRVTDAQGRLSTALKENVAPLSVPTGTNIPALPDQLQHGATQQGGAAPTGMKGYGDKTPGTAVAVTPKNAPTDGGSIGFNDLEREYLKERQRGY